jgi:hypothetical protein
VEAAKARDRLARKLHGPYARLNDLPEDPAAGALQPVGCAPDTILLCRR